MAPIFIPSIELQNVGKLCECLLCVFMIVLVYVCMYMQIDGFETCTCVTMGQLCSGKGGELISSTSSHSFLNVFYWVHLVVRLVFQGL